MTIRDRFLGAAKGILTSSGVFAIRRRYLPFGFDFAIDVSGLAQIWNHPIRVIFDVGAHQGQTAARLLDAFREAVLFSFEPHRATYDGLVDRWASSPRFRGFNLALSNKTGTADFFEYEMSQINSLVPNSRYAVRSGSEARVSTAECSTIDNFCRDHGVDHIDLLKIDTEGFDLAVLEGATRFLASRKIRFIYVEFNDVAKSDKAAGGSLVEIDGLLRQYGYRFVTIYTDYLIPQSDFFVVSNALFALPPTPTAEDAQRGEPVASPPW